MVRTSKGGVAARKPYLLRVGDRAHNLEISEIFHKSHALSIELARQCPAFGAAC